VRFNNAKYTPTSKKVEGGGGRLSLRVLTGVNTGYLTSPSRRDPQEKIYLKRRRDSRKGKGGFSLMRDTRRFQNCNFDSANHSVSCELGVPLLIWGVGAGGPGTRAQARVGGVIFALPMRQAIKNPIPRSRIGRGPAEC